MLNKTHLLPKLIILLFTAGFYSCKSGSVNLFKAASPHEQYQKKLSSSGLDKTAMGLAWIENSVQSIQKALTISVPYRETGYFSAEKVRAIAYQFSAVKGQKITVTTLKKPENSALYLDIWKQDEKLALKNIAFSDTLNNPVELEITDNGKYFIRIQPELLQGIEYTISIVSGPSLSFPTGTKKSSSIQSYWGDSRDANARKHEGVDIFGAFRSPVLAAANGTVTRVNQNNLGGKVVWLRPEAKNYNLYYAHLDEQLVIEGQSVKVGDTLGLMGNTGNAKTTPTHLHFGIYESGGATNPLPFIDLVTKTPPQIKASVLNLNKTLRTRTTTQILNAPTENALPLHTIPPATIVSVIAATKNYYHIEMPNGQTGFLLSAVLVATDHPIRKLKVGEYQEVVYDKPEQSAAAKMVLKPGEMINLLGNFENFQLISNQQAEIGWIVKR
ncbi:peptidoglycan DD-metalloendopeptidase family protein [Pedobacter sp. AW1-32]|uniref:peptidoglycan DD-metalloendopeptidase family protein n=1 Tax=Pedobacter sp. AW1-32 TaxID=3383026 RepID=UPI003FEFF5D1